MKLKTDSPIDYIKKVSEFRKSVFEKIENRNGNQVWLSASLKEVKRVVLINSSSRSGSSLLFAILKKVPQIYSLSGEEVPFYKLNGLSFDSLSSDRIPEELMEISWDRYGMFRDFLSDFSTVRNQDDIINDGDLQNQYIDGLILRFSLQWPQIRFSHSIFKKIANQALDIYLKNHRIFCKEEFYLGLLRLLRKEYPAINPYYYDIPQEMIKEKFSEIKVPVGPPNNIVMIEEPPFILLSPNRKLSKSDLSEKSLLLKSSVNCYRMNFIEQLFPNAEIKVIYLTRNPLASINGLYDGWLYRGFFSHNLNFFFRRNNTSLKELKISGYSDKYVWAKWWWNFDLPVGWQEYIDKSLQEVCAFQWYSANKAVHEYIRNGKIKYYRTRFENIIKSFELRVREIKKIVEFIGNGQYSIEKLGLDKLPVIQATCYPRFYRWKEKKNILLPLLDNPGISKMYRQLGYERKNLKEWL